MAHLEGLTAQEADDLEDEWRANWAPLTSSARPRAVVCSRWMATCRSEAVLRRC